MARPFSQGLEYFPVDVDMFDDPKVFELEEEFPKGEGSMFLIKIWGNIYSHSYYKKWTPITHKQFCRNTGYEPERANLILQAAIKIGLFDEKLYKNYGVLTSGSMQERWLRCLRRRMHVIIYKDHLLLSQKKIANLNIKGLVFVDTEGNELPKAQKQKTQQQNVPKAPKKGADQQSKNTYNHEDVLRDISKPYDQQPESVKSAFNKGQFQSYVNFNKYIDDNWPVLRNSSLQVTLSEYVKMWMNLKFTEVERNETLKLMAAGGISNQDMDARFEQYLGYVRNPKQSSQKQQSPPPKDNTPVLYDGTKH